MCVVRTNHVTDGQILRVLEKRKKRELNGKLLLLYNHVCDCDDEIESLPEKEEIDDGVRLSEDATHHPDIF